MRAVRITMSQVHYVNRAFWRNPARAFFTFAFPLMFLVIFTSLLGNYTLRLGTVTIKSSTYYVAAMAAFAVITSCYTNIAIAMSYGRDAGILKRIDGSPMPRGAFLGSRILHALGIAVVLVALTIAFGRGSYGAEVPTGMTLVRFLVMLLVGSGSFCALGLALTTVIPNADASAPIVNASILPLLFLSGIFIPFSNSTPNWVLWVSRVFPVRHFAAGMQAGLVGTPFNWVDVLIVAAWGAAGLLAALRFFRWEPSTS